MIPSRFGPKKRPSRTEITRSAEETERFGVQLARTLPVPGVVLLSGTLGTGKTTLARGIAEGLGLDDPSLVHSPSFTIVNIYQGKCPIYHVDLYRLSGERDIESIGLDDFLGSDGVTIVEWSEKLPPFHRADALVELEDAGDEERIIRVYAGRPPGRRKRAGRRKEGPATR